MINTLVIKAKYWDDALFHHPSIQSVKNAMQRLRPILVISVYLHLTFNIFLSSDSLLSHLIHHYPVLDKFLIDSISLSISALDIVLVMLFVTEITTDYLLHYGIQYMSLPILINLMVISYSFLLNIDSMTTYHISNYFFIILSVFINLKTYTFVQNKFVKLHNNPYDFKFLLWAALIILFNIIMSHIANIIHVQSYISSLLSLDFFTTFIGLLLISVIAPILYLLGISLPTELTNDQTTVNTVIANLDSVLKTTHTALPYPENLYSTYGSFGLFGGVGNTIVISFILMFSVSKAKQKIGRLSWIPSLFNSNDLLFFGLPLFFRPLMLIPMTLVMTISQLLSFLAIASHFIQPSVLSTPNTFPNILLPSITSQTPIRSTLLTVLILIISAFIYKPFINQLIVEVPDEK